MNKTLLAENYITSSCKVDKGAVFKDGEKLFENGSLDLSNFLLSVYQHFQLNYPKFYKMDNLSKLGWLASELLLRDSFKKDHYQPEEVGLVLANSNSSLDNDIKYFDSLKEFASPSLFVYTLPNIVIGEICIRNNFKGEHAFFIQDTFDAGFIEQQVNYLLDKNILKACICGWVDVLDQNYKAVLFWVEKRRTEHPVSFSAENMSSIFNNN
ncbi:MAG: hypothetical protein JWQ66_3597 [Mucilaginibacter sp.]|nr:hypothetical protein [Mucilaginibacter sp.]